MTAKLFMDCGAFSARSHGKTIDNHAYCRFLLENRRYCDVAAALDVIGNDADTYKLFVQTRELGVDFAIPTFHIGEDFKWLERYVRECDYIALGGTASRQYNRETIDAWFEKVWHEYLTDDNGFPLIRVHGFGMTQPGAMLRWPWYSVDSSSWIMAAATGKVLAYDTDNGIPVLRSLTVSSKSPDAGRESNVAAMTPMAREQAEALFTRNGFTIEELDKDYKKRFECNAIAFSTFAENVRYHNVSSPVQTSLFDPAPPKHVTRGKVAAWDRLTFYLAGDPGPAEMTTMLMEKYGYSRLVSYFYVKDNKDRHFAAAKKVKDNVK